MSRRLEIRVPDLGEFDEVDVVEVLVSKGDAVAAEDAVITLESDKASMDVPTPVAGVIVDLSVAVGDKVGEGDLIATLDADGRIDHGTMFFHAAKQGLVDPAASVQIGLRTHNPDTMGFNVLDAPWVHANGIEAVIEESRDKLGDKPVYVSFDIDCLDPSYAPGTGTPVCGGLTSHQALAILRGLHGINIVGADVVEVAPAYDVGEITALAGAHIAMEMLGMYAALKA